MNADWLFWGSVGVGIGCYALVGVTVYRWAAAEMRRGERRLTDLVLTGLVFAIAPFVVAIAGAAILFDAFHDLANGRKPVDAEK